VSVYLHGLDVLAGTYVDEDEALAQHVIAEMEAIDPIPQPKTRALSSQIPGVPDEAWTEFSLTMKTASPKSISKSGSLGMFEMKPRRLADLGLMRNVEKKKSWTGQWVPPLTESGFLSSAVEQYDAFGKSMRDYIAGLDSGAVPQPEDGLPRDMTLSGALAILHRCGPQGLLRWADGERFPETEALYKAANGIF
jgi:hypothetical protein